MSASGDPIQQEPLCKAPLEPTAAAVTFHVHNRRDTPVYFADGSYLCERRIELSTTNGQTALVELMASERASRCDAVFEGATQPQDCDNTALEPLAPGATKTFSWDGLATSRVPVASSCGLANAPATCLAKVAMSAGEITATVTYFAGADCIDQSCHPGAKTTVMSVDEAFDTPTTSVVDIDLR